MYMYSIYLYTLERERRLVMVERSFFGEVSWDDVAYKLFDIFARY